MDISIVKAILIDDEPGILEVSKQFLELGSTISVDTAISAIKALELIKVKEYDVVVSDYQMPHKDGIQLLKEIRAAGNEIPFILFTGKGREEVAIEALNSGADFYLQKGGDPKAQFAELANMIAKSAIKHRMERDLIENEEKFKYIFNSANDLIQIVDLDGRIIEINEVGCDWLGYAKQEMLQKNIRDIDSEQYAKQVPDRMKEILEKGFATFESEWVTRNGKLIPVEVSARRISYAGRPAILSVARDVTERKRAEETLCRSDERFSLANRATFDVIWDWNLQTNAIWWNENFQTLFGYRAEEIEETIESWTKRIHPEDLDRVTVGLHAAIDSGRQSWSDQYRFRRKDGTYAEIHDRGYVDREASGKPVRMVGAMQDITERKREEEALRDSEKRYRLLVESAAEVILVLQDGMIRLVNPIAIAMTGFSKQEIMSRPFPSFIHSDDRAMVVENHMKRLRDEAVPARYAFRLIAKDGSIKWVEISAVLIDWEGRPATLNFLTDITERKQTEDALLSTQAQLRIAMDLAKLVHWEYDVDKDLFTFDDQFFALYGSSEEKEGGRLMSSATYAQRFIPPEEAGLVAEETAKAIATSDPNYVGNVTHTMIRSDGERRIINVRVGVIKDAMGRTVKTFGANQDITELKLAEEALCESEHKYRFITENIGDMVRVFNIATQRYTYVSPSVERLTGFNVEETMQQTLKDVLHPDSFAELMRWLPTLIEQYLHGDETGKTRSLILRQRRKDGTWMDVEVVATPLLDDKGEFTEILGVMHDITDRVRAEQALHEANRKLNLLSSITRHDIKNQLMALEGQLTLLKMQQPDIGSNDHLLKAEAAGKRISAMIQLTKQYENANDHSPIWQDINALLRNASEDFQPREAKIVNDVPAGIEIFADPMVSKVFHNLIDNALRHGDRTSTIRFFMGEQDGARAIICEDDGIGIPVEMKEKIFMQSSGKDHGFGLFLSREILAITGITVTEKGELGGGARFVMCIPAEELKATDAIRP